MTPETNATPQLTPTRRTISLANHWIATGRRDWVLGAVQLMLESGSPTMVTEARDLLSLLVE